MKKRSAYYKDIFRELWGSKSRFLAIFAIIALGTGFFAGVKVTCPDMKLTADKYFEDYNLMDIRLVSTYGFNPEDIAAVKNSGGIKSLLPSYSADAIIKTDNEDKVAKIHALPLDKAGGNSGDDINGLRVLEGRLPQKSGECVVEKGKIAGMNLKLGEKITLHSGVEDKTTGDFLKKDTFEIVGYVETPYYLTFEKGMSSLGNGTVSTYVMIPEEDFKMEVYTDIFVTLENTRSLSAFSEEYKEAVKAEKSKLEDLAKTREEQRYREVYDEAMAKVTDAEKELAEGRKKQQEELTEALAKLERAETDIKNGRLELEKQTKLFQTGIASANKEIAKAGEELNEAEKQYSAQLQQFNADKALMSPEQAAGTGILLKTTRDKLDLGQKELESRKAELLNSKAQGEAKLKQSESKLDNSEKELNRGRGEYEKQKKASESELEAAEKEIANSRKKIEDIKKPKWYVMDRTYNPGYSSYEDDTGRIDAISRIFPVFFFMVAAFVCLTTMTRMVEEQRTQIGTLKALGYGNLAIASKYLVYAAIASAGGSIAGLVVGLKLFPFVITNAYSMLYRLPPTQMPFRMDYVVWITLGALACTSLAVYAACYKELMEQPSALMRPKSPKMGKRVFLERIPFLWSRFNFFSKVTIRNLFRYKKRLVMTLLGVAGCTSLMLAGFGLRDAISSIVPKQYGEIFKFNAMIILDENAKQQDKEEVSNRLESNSNINGLCHIRIKNYEAGSVSDWQKINLLVTEEPGSIDKFISLHERDNNKGIKLSDEGAVIGEKLADVLNLHIGDNMTIKVDDFRNVTVRIAGINENYTLHYVYMTPALYEKVFGEKTVFNGILVNMKEKSQASDDKISTDLVDNKAVLQMSFTRANQKSFSDMVGNLGSVVFVMIISAGALAFVVLYNLTNINITERIREIASIKVLGFYDIEVSQYVFRENIILTLINTCLGLLGGIVLNKFVLETSEIDIVMFGREIFWYSYVFSAALTVAFAVLVNVIMHFKLKKVSMIESLKSVE